jgi:hypothetical protein
MLILSPASVRFGTAAWDDVLSVTIDRAAARSVLEWSDLGPHAVFADVPEERLTIRVVRRLLRDTLVTLRPGDSAELAVALSPSAGGAQRKRVRVTCVVMGVEHDVAGARGATQSITLAGIGATGATDPVTVEDATDGAA